MMPDLPPELLEAILADPEADAPRLVAADWLDDAGDAEWAELIRYQCEYPHAKLRRLKVAERIRLQERERELVKNCVERWSTKLGDPIQQRWDIRLHRGFLISIDRAGCTMAEVTAILGQFPLLESVELVMLGTLPDGWSVPFSRMRNLRVLNLAIDATQLTWEEVAPLAQLARVQRMEITSHETAMTLIPPSMRERFEHERDRIQSQLIDESSRISAVRARLGSSLRTTTTGLHWWNAFGTWAKELRLAAALPSLRRLQVWLNSDEDFAALAGLTQLRSLQLEGHDPETFASLTNLTHLREIIKPYPADRSLPIFGEWLRMLPHLESFRAIGTVADDAKLLRQLSRCPSLRILHLPSVQVSTLIPKDVIFPEVTELEYRLQSLGTTEWIDQFPKLKVISSAAAIPRSMGLAYRERGIDFAFRTESSDFGPPIALEHTVPVELPHGIHLSVPAGLERIESPRSPYPQGADIELVAAWQEFGPGDEWPDLRILGPTRVWLERIAAPAGTQNAREWLTRAPTPFENVSWGKFIRIESESPIPPRVMMWVSLLRGVRAVWIGKHHILRMCCEYAGDRLTPWETILPGMIARVRVPKQM